MSELKELIACAKGELDADILIKNGTFINVITREMYKADITIKGKYIANVAPINTIKENTCKKIIDAEGKYVSPGFIETHLHIESTMLPPIEFSKAVMPHGTTTVLLDPHEIGNALGEKGLKLLIEQTKSLPLRFLVEIPSCVPAAPGLETSGNIIDSKTISRLIEEEPAFFGLGEVMNYPGVLFRDEEVLSKVLLGTKLNVIDGHSPGLTGRDLDAYISSGIESDHESTTKEEFLEKLRKGMHVLIRDGSLTKDLDNILQDLSINDLDSRNCTLCSDDRNIIDLFNNGHMNAHLRKAVKLGVPPIVAIQMVTINAATFLGLEKTIGSINPGKIADIIILEDIETFKVNSVIYEGRLVLEQNNVLFDFPAQEFPEWAIDTVKVKNSIKPSMLEARTSYEDGTYSIRVIGVMPHSVLTESYIEQLIVKNGTILPDLSNDILHLSVIERYGKNGNIANAFVKGFRIKAEHYAMATTVAHDSHNIIVAGTDTEIMAKAVQHLQQIRGGYVVIVNEDVYDLPLPYAGLMSTQTYPVLYKQLQKINKSFENITDFQEPMMALSFMALPVIPSLKLTDKGLVDVNKFAFTELIKTQ
ncbi:MAG: adenine deaminase [Candidatus Hodarchaeales archaeon]